VSEGHERRGREGVPKAFGDKPAGVEKRKGIELLVGLNHLLAATDRCLEQSPEGETLRAGTEGFGRRQANWVNGKRARPTDEVGTARQRGKPLR